MNYMDTKEVLWNRCFLCSSPLTSGQTERDKKNDYKRLPPTPSCSTLLKYLLRDWELSKPLSKSVLKVVKIENPLGGLRGKWCCFCENLAESINKLHLELEVIQMKIVDHLSTVGKAVISNSRLYGGNSEVKEVFQEAEKVLEEWEDNGRCNEEREFFEVLHQFQTFIFENDRNHLRIPLVYLEKYVGKLELFSKAEVMEFQTGKDKGLDKILALTPTPPNDIKREHDEDGPYETVEKYTFIDENTDLIDENDQVESLSSAPSSPEVERTVRKATRKKRFAGRNKNPEPSLAAQLQKRLRQAAKKSDKKGPSKRNMKNLSRVWKCEQCAYQTRTTGNMDHHLRSHETSEKLFECPDCQQRFTQQLLLEVHLLQHSRKRKCDVCDKSVFPFDMKAHLKTHSDKVIQCEYCDMCCGTFKKAFAHALAHPRSSLKCGLCPDSNLKVYLVRRELPVHLFECHEDENLFKCDFPGCSSAYFELRQLKSHKRCHPLGGSTHKCSICDTGFTNEHNLETHMKTLHPTITILDPKLADEKDQHPLELQQEGKSEGKSKYKFWQCETCDYQTRVSFLMENHLKGHETSEKNYTCSKCKQNFTLKLSLEVHMLQHSRRRRCDVCNDSVLPIDMKKHLETCHKKIFQCEFCHHCCGTFAKAWNHAGEHTKAKLKCDLCPESDLTVYSVNQQLPRHLFECHGQEEHKLQCDFPNCSEIFFSRTSLTLHKNIHKKRFECNICQKAFFHRTGLQRHMKGHNRKSNPPPPTVFHCDSCSQQFLTKKALNKHKMTNHDDPKFQCKICPDKQFLSYDGLRLHERVVHKLGKELPSHKCSDCSAEFHCKTHLVQHQIAKHKVIRDFICEVCGHSSKSQVQLRRHTILHFKEEWKHVCPHCQKKFPRSHHLSLHIRTHTKEKPFQCEFCGAAFASKSNMKSHAKTHRNQEQEGLAGKLEENDYKFN